MRLKIAFLVACLSLVALIGTSWAQAPATFVLKSGERISGDLIDLNASGYVITVNGQQRNLSPGDLAVIDFTGSGQNFPANETQKITPGQNLLVMRDGEMHAGRMNDVGGNQPKLIYFEYPGGPKTTTSDRIARIYLSTPPAATAATSGTGSQQPGSDQATTVHVLANRAWTPAGITVQQGQVLQFSSSGQVQLSKDANDTSPVAGRTEAQAPPRSSLPTTARGALIGRIGNGRPFGIGDQTSITAPASGPFYLGVNDDLFTDNNGEFVVTVTGGTPLATGIRRRR